MREGTVGANSRPRRGGERDKGWPRQPADRPKRVVQPRLNAPYPGCCDPFPDATFVNGELVKLNAHHNGEQCAGYLEPMSLEDWNASVDNRRAILPGDAR